MLLLGDGMSPLDPKLFFFVFVADETECNGGLFSISLLKLHVLSFCT